MTRTLIVTEIYSYEISDKDYQELLKDTSSKKLFHLNEDESKWEEHNMVVDRLDQIVKKKSLEQILVSDEEY